MTTRRTNCHRARNNLRQKKQHRCNSTGFQRLFLTSPGKEWPEETRWLLALNWTIENKATQGGAQADGDSLPPLRGVDTAAPLLPSPHSHLCWAHRGARGPKSTATKPAENCSLFLGDKLCQSQHKRARWRCSYGKKPALITAAVKLHQLWGRMSPCTGSCGRAFWLETTFQVSF